jgi:hypothetical protein
MIKVEGYKAFNGTMKITPKNVLFPPFEIKGDWLYKPEYDCWYDGKSSYPASICEVIEER